MLFAAQQATFVLTLFFLIIPLGNCHSFGLLHSVLHIDIQLLLRRVTLRGGGGMQLGGGKTVP